MSRHPAWLSRADAHLARVADPAKVHPADRALAIASMLGDLAVLRVRLERALGCAMLELEDHGGRPKPDEPLPERREIRVALGMHRTDLAAITWLARVPEPTLAVILDKVRASPATRAWSARSLQQEFGG